MWKCCSQECETEIEINLLVSFILQLATSIAMVQCLIRTTYWKSLWENVMAVLTPKLVKCDTAADCLLSYEQRGKLMLEQLKTAMTGSQMSGKKLIGHIGKSQWLCFHWMLKNNSGS